MSDPTRVATEGIGGDPLEIATRGFVSGEALGAIGSIGTLALTAPEATASVDSIARRRPSRRRIVPVPAEAFGVLGVLAMTEAPTAAAAGAAEAHGALGFVDASPPRDAARLARAARNRDAWRTAARAEFLADRDRFRRAG